MSLGNTLRAAREACGLTTSELAARTHMLVQIVEGLENEDFRRIPAPIYGRGFIKLYCEAVNLDPKPLQAEFMDLFNRAKDAPAKKEMPPVRSRPQTAEPPPPPPIAPVPEAAEPMPATEEPIVETADATETASVQEVPVEESPVAAQSTEMPQPVAEPPPAESLFDLPIQTRDPAPAVDIQPPPKRSYGELFGQAYSAEEEAPKQSAAEKFRNTMSNVSSGVFSNVQKLPTNIGRIAAVSLCAAFAVAIIAWGVFALYKATSPAEEAPVKNSETAAKEAAGPKSAEGNTGKKAGENTAGKGVIETVKTGTAYPSSRAVRPGDLKSSGIEIPALYID